MSLLLFVGCALTHHPVDTPTLVTDPAAFDRLLDTPGPLTVETISSADWGVDLKGLLNLDDPRTASLVDHVEPIKVYFHAIHHPTLGLFLIDTGAETAIRDDPKHSSFRGMVAKVMHLERMKVTMPLAEWLHGQPVHAVYLTHMHLDHISGMGDVPAGTAVWIGPGEAGAHNFQNLFTQPSTDRELARSGTLHELSVQPDPSGRFAGLVDVFGDGSLWGIWSPGHTPGSMAFVARTTTGPVLYTGDTSHTRWGWEHDVIPGTYTSDPEANTRSLAALRALAAAHPAMPVHLGHQE